MIATVALCVLAGCAVLQTLLQLGAILAAAREDESG